LVARLEFMPYLTAGVKGIGVLGPGIADWGSAAAILRGDSPYIRVPTVLPAPSVLPPAERRRAGRIIRLALAVGAEAIVAAQADASSLVSVFSSSGGDGENCHEICRTLASDDRQISPTRFHNSVHNAAAGYWSIAYGCTQASTSLCANDASFSAGLLEAATQLSCGAAAVMLLAYDADYPQPLRERRNIPDAFGVALILVPADHAQLARLSIELEDVSSTTLGNTALEALRVSIPAARALPLLDCLANKRSGTIVLDYLDHAALSIKVIA
jgi:hypothetical protein